MRILLIGNGGRESAYRKLFKRFGHTVCCIPGNVGMPKKDRVLIHPTNFDGIVSHVCAKDYDLVVIGSEVPLVAGLADKLAAHGIPVVGPFRAGAMLEGSKTFAGNLCKDIGIAMPEFWVTDDYEHAYNLIRRHGPLVVKADGLCAGKGVVVPHDAQEAFRAAHNCLVKGVHGDAGRTIVLQERLDGGEGSIIFECDGVNAIPFLGAQDYKRRFEGDRGQNTGGMGACAPHPLVDDALIERVRREMALPILEEMCRRGTPYHGFLYLGIILTDEGPKLIEINVRFGDPEAQAVFPLLKSDLAEYLLDSCTFGGLACKPPLEWKPGYAVCIACVTLEYPNTSVAKTDISVVRSFLGGTIALSDTSGSMILAGSIVDDPKVDALWASGRALYCVGYDSEKLYLARAHAINRAKQICLATHGALTFRPDIAGYWSGAKFIPPDHG